MGRNGMIIRILVAFALACSLTSIYLSTRPQWTNGSDHAHANVPVLAASGSTRVKRIHLTVDESLGKHTLTPELPEIVRVRKERSASFALKPTTASQSPPPLSLDLFRAKYAPIISSTTGPPSKEKPVRIRVLLFEHKGRRVEFRKGNTWAIGDEVLNICMDGWKISPYFEFLNATVVPDFNSNTLFQLRETQDVVWVADMRRIVYGKQYTISQQLVDAAQKTLDWQRQHNINATLKVVLMDYRDRLKFPHHCTKGVRKLITLLGVGNVVSVKQQVLQGRYWNETAQFPNPGRFFNSSKDVECFGRPTLRVPYTVRSDYAEAVQEMYSQYLPPDNKNSSLLPPDTVRTIDVAHFWPSKKVRSHAAVLRSAVTDLVVSLNGTTPLGSRLHPLRVIGDFVSAGATLGRTKVSNNYLESLLTTKIVIVAQRDMWEDHYRLFEAVSGGALVMTDPMLTLPDGLVDGENIIVYRSLDHLRKLVLHYVDPAHSSERLEIARAGWKLAMGRHRTYHWMEELFFGDRISASPLSQADTTSVSAL